MIRDPFDKPPPRRDDDDDREKKSWRELDAQRDRSAHVSREDKPRPETKSARLKKRGENLAKKALEEFFQGRKSKEQAVAWKHVCEAQGKSFSVRANHYIEKHGFPREWDDLLRLLDHADSAIVERVLDQFREVVGQESATRKDVLIGKLRIMKMTNEDPKLLQKMEEMLQMISAQL